MRRDINHIVDTLKNARQRGEHCCTLLIGAGCSIEAGIPLASGFVKEIEKRYPSAYAAADPKTYPWCMRELAPGLRKALIAEYVDRAKINWAHIAIAQLIKHGYVGRVLTVNFDPLVVRACALLGVFPAVYDFASSQLLKPAEIPDPAVFYLHGQRTGFVLMNTEEECAEHSKRMEPVFRDAGRGRTWIVAGYSGESDPVFEHLARVECFDHNLYWVGYKDSEPAAHVRGRLLCDGKYAFFVSGFDADGFFVTLAQRLECFPPGFVDRPFSHLDALLKDLTPYRLPGETTDIDVMAGGRKMIQAAIADHEVAAFVQAGGATDPGGRAPAALRAVVAAMRGDYEAVAATEPRTAAEAPLLVEMVAWAQLRLGNALLERAEQRTGDEAEGLLVQAAEKYQAALRAKPDKHEALYNWGNALSERAKARSGEEAERLLVEAGQRYEAAVAVKPDKHEALYNWGNTLYDRAKRRSGVEADQLLALAAEKYAAALATKPDKSGALNNWGLALWSQAEHRAGAEADRLLVEAEEKYAEAIRIDPELHVSLYNWGNAISRRAESKAGEEADRLWERAGEKYEAALRLQPDMHQAYCNWGNALSRRAEGKRGGEADRLWEQAGEKYEAALHLKPDMDEALNNWGNALSRQAAAAHGDEADRLFALAEQKFASALRTRPGKYETLCNWGNALSIQARRKAGDEAVQLFAQAGGRYAAALQIRPDLHGVLNAWGLSLMEQAKRKGGEDANRLIAESREKLLQCESLCRGVGAYNLACLAALQGDEEQCKEWLARSYTLGHIPSPAHLDSDADLDRIRGTEWFGQFLAKVRASAA